MQKKRKKQKQRWWRDFYRESHSTYRYPFCLEQMFTKKRPEMYLKIHFFHLLLTWLNRGVNSQYLSRQHQREDGCDHTRKKSQSGHGALFMVRGFALSSMGNETPKKAGVSAEVHLTREKQPPLRDKKYEVLLPTKYRTWIR